MRPAPDEETLIATALTNRAETHLLGGEPDLAAPLLERALDIYSRLQASEIERDLGAALETQGDRPGARAARLRAITLFQRIGATRTAAELAALIR